MRACVCVGGGALRGRMVVRGDEGHEERFDNNALAAHGTTVDGGRDVKKQQQQRQQQPQRASSPHRGSVTHVNASSADVVAPTVMPVPPAPQNSASAQSEAAAASATSIGERVAMKRRALSSTSAWNRIAVGVPHVRQTYNW